MKLLFPVGLYSTLPGFAGQACHQVFENHAHSCVAIPGQAGAKKRPDIVAEFGVSTVPHQILFKLSSGDAVPILSHVPVEAGEKRFWIAAAGVQGVPNIEEISTLPPLIQRHQSGAEQLAAAAYVAPMLSSGISQNACSQGKRPAETDGYTVMTNIKVIVEKHPDGYVAYPLGLKGVVVGEGDTYEDALADVRSAIRFHIETFGDEVLQAEPPVLEAFVAESGVAI